MCSSDLIPTDSTVTDVNIVPLAVQFDSLGNEIVPQAAVSQTEQMYVPPVVDYSTYATAAGSMTAGKWEACLYEKVSIGNGNQTNNPWLLEMPDPISKVTWDNYITINPADAGSDELKFNLMLRQDRMGSDRKSTRLNSSH